MSRGGGGKQPDKPIIFTLQGVLQGCQGGTPGMDKMRERGRAAVECSPLLGSLGGAWRGDRSTRVYTTILVLSLLL